MLAPVTPGWPLLAVSVGNSGGNDPVDDERAAVDGFVEVEEVEAGPGNIGDRVDVGAGDGDGEDDARGGGPTEAWLLTRLESTVNATESVPVPEIPPDVATPSAKTERM